MSRGRIGIKKTNSDTEATGIWNLTEQQQLKGNNQWVKPKLNVFLLVVGGGASGTDGHNSGGMGGQVNIINNLKLVVSTSYTITVGNGGSTRGDGNSGGFNSGSNSSFSGNGISYDALGANQANGTGAYNTNGTSGRNGGSGVQWSINNTYYAGGGGTAGGNGYETSAGGSGGTGGGGTGSTCCSTAGTAGQANTGGGGGGGGISWCGNTYCGGRAGGSGIVIVAYLDDGTTYGSGGSVSTTNGYRLHTFTGSGTFTVSSVPN